jgi:hypothetical protein
MNDPAAVIARLTAIEEDLAERQNRYEAAAESWYRAQREMGRRRALALLTSERPSVTEKKAEGELAAYDVEGAVAQAEYEALKAAVGVLETRAVIGTSILKAQGRV